MKKEIVKCVCGEWTKPKMFKIEGFDVRGSECPKCKEGYLNGEDTNLVYKFNQLKKQKLKATVTTTGNSYAIRIPKALVDLLNLKKPDNARGISLMRILKNPDDPKERDKFWRGPIYSEAWKLDLLDRIPGYKSSKRIFTVRKGKYKLRVKQELGKHMRVLTENYHLVNWVDNEELDIQRKPLIFEDLRRLLHERTILGGQR